MMHGLKLYVGVWENKPAIYLPVGVVQFFGPSLVAIRVVTAVAVEGTVFLVYRIGRSYAGRDLGLAAGLMAGILLGVPFLGRGNRQRRSVSRPVRAFAVAARTPSNQPGRRGSRWQQRDVVQGGSGIDTLALAVWLSFNRRRRGFCSLCLGLDHWCLCGGRRLYCHGHLWGDGEEELSYDLGYVGRGYGTGVPWLLLLKLGVVAVLTVLLRRLPFPYI